MNGTATSSPIIRRILVALDTSSHSMAALETGAQLAIDLKAELQGVYIEDADLLNAADLPFVQEIRSSSFTISGLSSASVERQFRIQASRARQALESIASQSNIPFSFSVARGQVAAELLAAAARADLLLLGKASTRFSSRRKLGRTARTILRDSLIPTLIIHDRTHLADHVLLVYDESETADRMLNIGAQLAGRRPTDHLCVLFEAATEEKALQLKDRLTETLQQSALNITLYAVDEINTATIALMGQETQAGVIMISASNPLVHDDSLQAFLHEVDRPVLLVRWGVPEV